jgi:N-acetylglucosaminyldiphosphoundecaprenol N-acetyl-beta-D-mannosaminyltransferase
LPEVELRGIGIHAISEKECVDHILDELDQGRGGWVVTPNLDHMMRAGRDDDFRSMYEEASLRVADGMLILWACGLQRTPLPERVAGSDLISSLSSGAAKRGRSIFLLGGNPGAAKDAAQALTARYPGLTIAGIECPPMGFEQDPLAIARLSRKVHEAKPDIVYVALGSPKQERVIRHLRHDRPEAWWLGVGISFSFLSGEVQRAPRWMRRCGLEWFHRLCMEPRRLFKRYVVQGMPFAASLLAGCALRGTLPKARSSGTYGRQAPRALLVDDDPVALEHLEIVLTSRFPDLQIEKRLEPEVHGAPFDFYFLDNDFDGEARGAELAAEIRKDTSSAVVFAFSGTLDVAALKGLINAGCDGVCEKGAPKSWRSMLDLVDKRLGELADQHQRRAGSFGGVRSAAHSIHGLLENWNDRGKAA